MKITTPERTKKFQIDGIIVRDVRTNTSRTMSSIDVLMFQSSTGSFTLHVPAASLEVMERGGAALVAFPGDCFFEGKQFTSLRRIGVSEPETVRFSAEAIEGRLRAEQFIK